MQFRISRVFAAAAAALTMMTASVASAQPAPTGSATCPSALSTAAVNFGSPTNSSDKSQVNCTDFGDGSTVYFTAAARFNGLNPNPPAVVEISTGVYLAMAGAGNAVGFSPAQWNFNYAIVGFNPTDTYKLLIDRDPGLTTNFQTFTLVQTPPCDPGSSLCYQNSENEAFFNTPSDVFDPNALGTYTFQIEQFRAGTLLHTASENVVVGTPEPASIALFATGLVGLVPIARRRRNRNAA